MKSVTTVDGHCVQHVHHAVWVAMYMAGTLNISTLVCVMRSRSDRGGLKINSLSSSPFRHRIAKLSHAARIKKHMRRGAESVPRRGLEVAPMKKVGGVHKRETMCCRYLCGGENDHRCTLFCTSNVLGHLCPVAEK